MSSLEQVLEVRRQQYLHTKNPVFVWSAVALLVGEQRPLPDWVRDYLGRVATNLDTLSRRHIPRKNELPRAVYRALEFGKQAAVNPFAAQTVQWHRLNIAIEVWSVLGVLNDKLDAAIHHVVQTHRAFCTRRPPCRRVSRSTVLRAWHDYRDIVVIPGWPA